MVERGQARAHARARQDGGESTEKEGPGRAAQAVAAYEQVFEQPARFSFRRWGARLERVAVRIDRYAEEGRGRPGAWLEELEALLADHRERAAAGTAAQPMSLAYFLPELERRSKRLRRQHKPRIQASRAAARLRALDSFGTPAGAAAYQQLRKRQADALRELTGQGTDDLDDEQLRARQLDALRELTGRDRRELEDGGS